MNISAFCPNLCHNSFHVVALSQEFVHTNLVHLTDAIHTSFILAESTEFGGDTVEWRTKVHISIPQGFVFVVRPNMQHDLKKISVKY